MMLDIAIRDELINRVGVLPLEMQQRVLDFAHALAVSAPRGTPGKSLLRFAGSLDDKEAEEMLDAMTASCEHVDANEW